MEVFDDNIPLEKSYKIFFVCMILHDLLTYRTTFYKGVFSIIPSFYKSYYVKPNIPNIGEGKGL